MKRFLARLLTVVVFGAIVYYAGWFQGRGGFRSETSDVETLRGELQVERNRGRLMHLRSILFQVVMDIHNENFGVARERLQSAAKQLKEFQASDAPQTQAIHQLGERLGAIVLGAGADPALQQERILNIASELDAHLPAESEEDQPL